MAEVLLSHRQARVKVFGYADNHYGGRAPDTVEHAEGCGRLPVVAKKLVSRQQDQR